MSIYHEADGIYYVTDAMLQRTGACPTARRIVALHACDDGERTLVTLDLLRTLHAATGIGWWVREHVKQLSAKERDASAYGPYVGVPLLVMNALARRARREGR